MFDRGALLRAERPAVALLKCRDLLLDRREAKVVCESAYAVTSRGLRIGDLGTCNAQLLTACVRSQQVVRNRRRARRRLRRWLGRAKPSDLLEVCAVLGSVGGALGVLDIGEAGNRHRDRRRGNEALLGVSDQLCVALREATGRERQIELAMSGCAGSTRLPVRARSL